MSNRGPVSFTIDAAGDPEPGRAGGGLAATLGAGIRDAGAVWVAAAMGEGDRLAVERAGAGGVIDAAGYSARFVTVDPADYRAYYDVIANQTLWFWHHHLFDTPRRPRLDRRINAAWQSFRGVNLAMAEGADLAAAENATVLVHDYHLSLVPAMLRARRPDVRIVHFSHTAFVDRGMVGLLPSWMVAEILDGLSGADACGFHSSRSARRLPRLLGPTVRPGHPAARVRRARSSRP